MPIRRPDPKTDGRAVLGWREWVGLPSLGVPRLKAKVDTGALSSALHAFDLEEYRDGGLRRLRFTIHPWQDDVEETIRVDCPLVGERSVRSSAGHLEVRPVVAADVVVGAVRVQTELTLTNRDAMGFRMLLGRSAFRGRFLVDADRSFVQGRPRRTGRPANGRPAGAADLTRAPD